MKLTPRQIEVLTEIFAGIEPDWRGMTPAQRAGRARVRDSMRGWRVKNCMIESRTGKITLLGLQALAPHYPNKPKIEAAINARRALEDEIERAEILEKQQREDKAKRQREARKAKLIEGYRKILADCHFDQSDKPDDLILDVGNRIADFEQMA